MANVFLVQMQLKCSLSVEVSLFPFRLVTSDSILTGMGFHDGCQRAMEQHQFCFQSAEVTARIDGEKFSSIEIDVIILVKNVCGSYADLSLKLLALVLGLRVFGDLSFR